MTDYRGSCLCGASAFEVSVAKREIDSCHCGMCRRWGGGPTLNVLTDGPPRFDDESALGVYRSSDWAERVFCKGCGSSLMWRTRDGKHHSMPVGLLGDEAAADFAFSLEIFVDDKPGFYAFAGDRPCLTGAQVMALFAAED